MTTTKAHAVDWSAWKTWRELEARPEILQRLAGLSGSELHIQQELRREFPDDLVRAALTLQTLRGKAAGKFADADRLWFDRVAFEQATGDLVARHKAQRFQGLVWDYCCGMGSDAAALARRGCDVVAVDLDPLNCLRARWNAGVWCPERPPAFVCADVETLGDRSGLLHIDPDRRVVTAAKAVRIEDYTPGPEFLARMTHEFAGGAIKLSPAANFGGKFTGAEVELVSVQGECKEATIWFGNLRGEHSLRATVLPAGETISGEPLAVFADTGPVQAYLHDPDPAVVRAGLVDHVAVQLGCLRLDSAEEYLTGPTALESGFVRSFEVLAELPNNPKEIRKFFRESRFGRLEIKCRHIRVDVTGLHRQLTLPGTEPGVLFIARVAGKARAIVGRRIARD